MRTISFRAWDKENNRMILPEWVVAIIWTQGEDVNWIQYNEGSGIEQLHHSKFELMQFTGQLDRNGKEIYEGDILKTEYARLVEISPVVWGFYNDGEYLNNAECWMADGWPLSDLGGLYGASIHTHEIIGNIYESPESLEGEQK